MQGNDVKMMVTVIDGPDAGKKSCLTGSGILQEKKTGLIELEGRRVFCEILGQKPILIICGGGHVSISVIRLGKSIGYQVIVLEERIRFADRARQAGADEVICDSFECAMERIEGTEDTYFVIVTRGHRYDTVCLRAALGKKHAYIGMMGSRTRVGIIKEQLASEGFEKEKLETVHAPIGLDIGAETPEEIAVSVAAELIQVKSRAERSEGYSEEILSFLMGEKEEEKKKVLAVIVARKGSAPRKVGTKMLVSEDGLTVGTIGGGCAEARIINESLLMMRTEAAVPKVLTVDMTKEEAEDEGMVCGGTIEVYLEPVRCEEYRKLGVLKP